MSAAESPSEPVQLSPEVSLRRMGPDHCIAWYRNVQLILSNEPADADFMREITSQLRKIQQTTGARPGVLLIIRADVGPPSDEARQVIREELAHTNLLAAAQVVQGTGFRGAAMRSVLSMLQLAIRPSYSMRVFGDKREACEWLVQQLANEGPKLTPGALLQVATSVERHFRG